MFSAEQQHGSPERDHRERVIEDARRRRQEQEERERFFFGRLASKFHETFARSTDAPKSTYESLDLGD